MLRAALISANFGEEVRPALVEQGAVNGEAFAYSLRLFEKAHGRIGENREEYRPAVRDQGFRRAIVTAYSHRCALCGIRMVTPDGHTVVDAAHIVPWSESRNDAITNGMALCRLCHWTFDEGMIGVRDDYTVIISALLARDPNVPGFLLTSPAGRSSPPKTVICGRPRTPWPGIAKSSGSDMKTSDCQFNWRGL
jgi:putative restriction endonuclease